MNSKKSTREINSDSPGKMVNVGELSPVPEVGKIGTNLSMTSSPVNGAMNAEQFQTNLQTNNMSLTRPKSSYLSRKTDDFGGSMA
jgi:hypothetical protein